MRFLLVAASTLALTACGLSGTDTPRDDETAAATPANDLGYDTYSDQNAADTMASDDARYMNASADGSQQNGSGTDIPDSQERPIMQAQVVLDRRGFGPGVVDGKMGMSTTNALRGYQEANGLTVTGKLDDATKQSLSDYDRIPATRVVTIPASWGNQTYTDIPEDTAAKAKMKELGYKSLDERLAERFHTTVAVLKELNPNGRPAGASTNGASPSPSGSASASPKPTGSASPSANASGQTASFFKAGQQIRVPNIGADAISPGEVSEKSWQQTLASLGVGTDQPKVDRIVVSKSKDTLRAYQGDKLVALFTVSSGSSEFPLPLGEWKILGEAYNPPYSYDPEVLGKSEGKTYKLPPGPNGPVGVVWIDLSKEHYGIHGTPDPETIGRAQSSGCVRLTNWDAARLAQMVNTNTDVLFEA